MTSTDVLDRVLDRGNKITDTIQTGVRHLNAARLSWKPEQRQWNIGEVLQHLITLNSLYYPIIDSALTAVSGKSEFKDAGELFRGSLTGNMMLKIVLPENKKKTRTPRRFEPLYNAQSTDIVDAFLKNHYELITFMQRSKGLNLTKIRVHSPLNRILRFNLGDCYYILISHDERHLNQIQRITQFRDFPGELNEQ